MDTRAAAGARLLGPSEGDSFTMMGIRVTPKVTAADSGGAFSQIEQVVQPGAGSPPHFMHNDFKVIYVVDGKFDIRIGERVLVAEVGATAIIPAGTVHNFRNTGERAGTLLVTSTPAGHERFMRAMAAITQDGPPSRDALLQVAHDHHVTMLVGD